MPKKLLQPQDFTDKCIQKFLNSMFTQTQVTCSFVNWELLLESNRLKNYFCCEGFLSETLRSSFFYKFLSGNCIAWNFGKTFTHFKVRVSGH